MEEELIKDFMAFGKYFTYDDPKIENIQIAGEWVMFTEVGSGWYEKEQHKISILEILAFVSWRALNAGDA